MAKRLVGWLVLVPLCVVLVAFALANRHLVALNINPFGSPAPVDAAGFGVPLFIILYVMLLVGVLLGGIATWFSQGPRRRAERHWRREAQHLGIELEALRRRTGQAKPTPTTEVDDILELR